MRKILTMFLAVIICLSMSACGASDEQLAKLEVFSKYEELIALLEAEDYEGALENIQNRMPVPEEPSYSEIEITMDNWDEYFILENTEKWSTNSFGETDELSLDVVMHLKPEYADRVVDTEKTKIDFDISSNQSFKFIDIDYAAQTYTFTGLYMEDPIQQVETLKYANLTREYSVFIGRIHMLVNDAPVICSYENVTLNRIRGTLCLYDE